MAKDVFPSTMCTWINQELGAGQRGRREVNAFLMRTYAWPLQVYFLGTNQRWLGDPEDVVAGFFADRLARPGFLADWQASGLRLRRWLMNGFCFYLREQSRKRRADRRLVAEAEEPITFTGDPNASVDRAAVVAFVHEAIQAAEDQCLEEGLETHWRAFLRHHLDGASMRELSDELGVNAARAAVMVRTAKRKFRHALAEVLGRDGVPPDEVEEEIRSLLEVSGR